MFYAWLCYERLFEDEDPQEQRVTIEFTKPPEWQYDRVVPICFSVLKPYEQ